MKAEGMKSRVIEIKADQHHGLYIVQSGRALADMPEPDRAWAGPIPSRPMVLMPRSRFAA